jgi:hypothetical protein
MQTDNESYHGRDEIRSVHSVESDDSKKDCSTFYSRDPAKRRPICRPATTCSVAGGGALSETCLTRRTAAPIHTASTSPATNNAVRNSPDEGSPPTSPRSSHAAPNKNMITAPTAIPFSAGAFMNSGYQRIAWSGGD